MSEINITWLGTASVKIETEDTTLLIDPFIELKGAENRNDISDFSGADAIFITHAHLDHLASVPRICSEYPSVVYCTECAARLLKKYSSKGGDVRIIKPGMLFSAGDISVSVYQGKHIKFDRKLVLRTLSPFSLAKCCGNIPALFWQNIIFREKGETVFYDIHTCGKHIQIIGSLALRENVEYPYGADILFLPYQGSSYLEAAAERVLNTLRPGHIILTHFDNAFPPISQTVSTDGLVRLMKEKFPDIRLTVPEFGQRMIF